MIAARLLTRSIAAPNWIDLGSGGGSPALPMKIVRRQARLTMTESRSRKAAFLRTAAHRIGLENVGVRNTRVEDLPPATWGTFDVATVRGVRIDQELAGPIQRLLAPGGILLLFLTAGQGQPDLEEFHILEEVPLIPSTSAIVMLQRSA
jgi:16S rRNA (guanine527-N7)-methyltransferase